MKESLNRLLTFLLPILVLAVFVEVRLHNTESRYSRLVEVIEEKAKDTKVLVFGSSHGVYNIIPSEMPSATLNLSNISQSLIVETRIINNFKNKFPQLNTVIMSIASFSLGYLMHETQYKNRARLYFQHYGFWGDGQWYQHLGLENWLLSLTYDAEDLRREFRLLSPIQLAEPVGEWGGFNQDLSKMRMSGVSEKSGQGRALHHIDMYKEKNREIILARLRETVSQLEADNVRVIFVVHPAYQTYTKHFDEKYINAIVRDLEPIAETKNYFKDSRFQRADFYNNDHLNSQGALKFSQILSLDLFQTTVSQ